eukprot:CAMPEP_0172671922 /NCGR_PEP_ID=MMETSP1074-20121228/11221_1 /TAXON_ID=2916 /ORGANISM="Ceratium fusus, Strain PA161109" /LENGTH=294 /DNA_ID=CAMNT_0013489035 /DNA_START=47 /DNA_END=931 /DNA_ORIENTATION=+
MTLLQGMCLEVVRQLAVTVAENLQRYAQRSDPPKRYLNIMGVLLGVCTAPLDMVAYSVAPQSMLAPFGMLQLLLNFAVAHVHGDKFRRSDVLATLSVIVGSLICLHYGAPSSNHPVSMPPKEALQVYAACVSIACACLAGLLVALNKVGGRADAFTNCMLGGLLGSTVLVSSKLLAASLISEERTVAAVALALIPLAILAPVHLAVINRAFGRHPLVFVSPTVGTCGLLVNVATGCFLYGETPVEPIPFAAGVIVLCFGVVSLRTLNSGGGDAEQCLRTTNNDDGQHGSGSVHP